MISPSWNLASKLRVETVLRVVLRAILVLALAMPAAEAVEPTVATTSGTFTAVPSPNAPGTDVFLGIRYAAPPMGALRWQPPQAPTPVTGTVVAGTAGATCPQPSFLTPQSEDCLFLNVYVPASARPDSALPVLFFIHGGGTQGAAIQLDPSVLVAENDIIAVVINYRVGALGWMADPALAATNANAFQNVGDAGDYGLMDQQFAMQWVQKNIKGFGGDPRKVTIGGQSFGAFAVWDHLTSTETARGLFRGAIVESAASGYGGEPTQALYESIFASPFDMAVGCPPPTDADCLRSQPVTAVLNAQNVIAIGQVTGTKILPQQPLMGFQSGQFIHVPVLQGTTANEDTLLEPILVPSPGSFQQAFAAGGPANLDLTVPNSFCATPILTGTPAVCSTYVQELDALLTLLGIPPATNTATFDAQLAADYPLANFPDPYLTGNAPSADAALSQVLTDLVDACRGLQSNQDLAKFVPLFAYEFNDPLAPPPQGITAVVAPNDANGFPTAAAHASDLHFLFTLQFVEPQIAPLDPSEQRLAHEIKRYWANFVKTGNPNFGSDGELNTPWVPFNLLGFVQELVPPPQTSHSSLDFSNRHFCTTWLPINEAVGR